MKFAAYLSLQIAMIAVFIGASSVSAGGGESDDTANPGDKALPRTVAIVDGQQDTEQRGVAHTREVYVATNRQEIATLGMNRKFDSQSGSIHYAKCNVAFGRNYRRGDLKNITIQSTHILKPTEDLPKPDISVLVFVHGFCVSFDESIQRGAQIAHELDHDGLVFVFAWPSIGQMTPRGYLADQATVRQSAESFLSFLSVLGKRFGGRNVQVLAHSLGCRLVAESVLASSEKSISNSRFARQQLANILLAAPDIVTATFKARYMPALTAASQRVTVYFSNKDGALLLAEQMDGARRLGQTGFVDTTETGVEFVDYSAFRGGFMNLETHKHYREHPLLLRDIRGALSGAIPASHRQLLGQKRLLSLTVSD